ncbi:MAG: cytidylate kinase-like family protein [Sphaerochaeta sp.]|uniref:cytidylate kinase-like family protein n=1 Tax=Sphaerochaeta sp. TaxID=1972642 RepID=UPI002FC96D1A
MGVITISRQIGSEGTFIAKRVAEQLGLSFVDKEDIEKVMYAYGFSAFDEVYNNKPSFWQRFDQHRMLTVDFLLTAMRAFAKVGDVVLLGRGGFGLFQGYTDILNIRLKAPLELRVQRKQKEYGTTEEAARKALLEQELVRTSFVQSDLQFNQNDASLFDLVIDTGIVPPETAALWIADAYQQLVKHPRLDAKRSRADLDVDGVLLKLVRTMLGSEEG